MSVRVECFGVVRDVSVALTSEPVAVGDYVLVRAGRYVVERIDPQDALQSLALMEGVLLAGNEEEPAVQRLGVSAIEA
jgi:hydrogenase expression/formation protein HypC